MEPIVYWGSLAALAALLVYVVWSDLSARRIPNWLNLAVALLALAYWWSREDVPFLPVLGAQLATAFAVFALNGVFWLRGWLGGGDLKLLTALALWLPVLPLGDSQLLRFLVLMSLAGIVLHVAAELVARLRKSPGRVKVPYGLAISFAALAVIGEPIVNRLSA